MCLGPRAEGLCGRQGTTHAMYGLGRIKKEQSSGFIHGSPWFVSQLISQSTYAERRL